MSIPYANFVTQRDRGHGDKLSESRHGHGDQLSEKRQTERQRDDQQPKLWQEGTYAMMRNFLFAFQMLSYGCIDAHPTAMDSQGSLLQIADAVQHRGVPGTMVRIPALNVIQVANVGRREAISA